jgi:elongator complex protein 1
MRNLVCEDHAVRELGGLGGEGRGPSPPATTPAPRVDAFCCADDRLYLATSTAGIYCVDPEAATGSRGSAVEWSVQLLPPPSTAAGPPAADAAVAALSAQPELGGLFVGLADGGELLVLRPPPPQKGSHDDVDVEEVGALAGDGGQGGLAAAAWSPDGALLAAATRAGRLLLLTGAPEWEVLAEVDIPRGPEEDDEEDGNALLDVEITWRGDGRFFATASAPRGSTSGGDDSPQRRTKTLVHIWAREEEDPEPGGCTAAGAGGHPSAFCGPAAAAAAAAAARQRYCVLHATAEEAPGLTGAVAWQPNCRHLFAAQVVPAGHDVDAVAPAKGKLAAVPAPQRLAANGNGNGAAPLRQALISAAPRTGDEEPGPRDQPWLRVALFERNGLKHGGFEVVPPHADAADDAAAGAAAAGAALAPPPSHRVRSLAWSPDSELLAAVLEPTSQQQPWAVQVWHRRNWHWYLKQELRLGGRRDGSSSSGSGNGNGRVLACWDDAAPAGVAGVLHVVSSGLNNNGASSSVRYDRLRFAWAPCVTPLGTALVVDGQDVLVTPCRVALLPPPMCAARLRCGAPVCALAVAGPAFEDPDEDDQEEDEDGQEYARLVWGASSSNAAKAERLAAVLAGGRLAVAAAVEDDLWEETLEEAEAEAGEFETAAAAPRPGRDRFGAPLLLAAEAVGGGASATPPPPLARGRPVRLAAWVSSARLLLVAAPALAEDAAASGSGDVLVEIELFSADAGSGHHRLAWRELGACRAGATVLAAASVPGGGGGALVQLAGGRLARYLPCSGTEGGRLLPLGPAAGFPAPCPVMIALPRPLADDQQPQDHQRPWAVGLDPSTGRLFLGAHALASDATSVAVRSDGAGGPALLWTCRGDVLRVALLSVLLRRLQASGGGGAGAAALAGGGAAAGPASLPSPYLPARPQPAPPPVSRRGDEHILRGELRQAIATAMRPAAASRAVSATLALPSSQGVGGGGSGKQPPPQQQGPMPLAPLSTRETLDARPVEQGARLVCSPCGSACRAVLQMPRGNLEAVAPRLLALVAAASAVRAGRWREAWRLVGEHRLDPNLLADCCGSGPAGGGGEGSPARLLLVADADAFVAAAPSAAELCDFVHALRSGSTLRDADEVVNAAGQQDADEDGDGAAAKAASSSWGAARAAAATAAEAEATPVAGLYAALPETAGMPDLAGPKPQPGTPEANKVTLVCTAIREAVLRRAAAAGDGDIATANTTATPGSLRSGDLRVVVATYARSDPPDLEAALLAIKDAKEAALKQEQEDLEGRHRRDGKPTDAAGEAIRHLLLHVDSDRLYEAALGLYDLPLAFAVASEAQRDPGAALEELRALGRERDPNLRAAAVDARLGRHDRAAANLLAAGPAHFDRALSLAKEHAFTRRFVAMVRGQRVQGQESGAAEGEKATGQAVLPSPDTKRSQLNEALAAYGEHLLASGRAEDAALAFAAASRPSRAVDAYRAAGSWRAALACAAAPSLGWSPERVRALAAELVDELAASGQAAGAAEIALDALSDVDRAAQLFSEAGEWRRALQACYCRGRGDLVETVVAPSAAAAASSLLEEAREAEGRVRKYAARLAEVRGRREAVGAALARLAAEGGFVGGGEDNDNDNDGAVSEAPSVLSGFSAYTDASTAAFGGGFSSSSSSDASSFAPSTLGGRPAGASKAAKKAARDARKASRRGAQGRIKQGGFLEEVSLASLVLSLAPPPHTLAAAGALAEALVLLGHAQDAARVQSAVSAWQRAAAEARAAVAARPPPEDEMRQAEPEVRRAVERAVASAEAQQPVDVVAWKWDLLRE